MRPSSTSASSPEREKDSKLQPFSLSKQKDSFALPKYDIIDKVVPNLRDLSVASELADMPPGLLYRAARPFSRSLNDIYDVYVKTLRIQTIIDLRDDDLSAIPEELESRLFMCRFYTPYSVTASRPKTHESRSTLKYVKARLSESDRSRPRHRDEPRGSLTDRSDASSSSPTARDADWASAVEPEDRRPPNRHVSRKARKSLHSELESQEQLRKMRPDLCEALVKELVSDPEVRPVLDILLAGKKREKKLLVVNIFDAPQIRKRVMETVSSSPYLPMLALAKVTDKLTGSALAPFYFCKYIMSAHELVDSYVEMLKTTGENYALAMKLMALSDGPVLFHCSLGKDRTGILAMLVLSVLGAQPSGIIFDYSLSEMSQNEAYQAYIRKFVMSYSGLSEDFCGAGVDTMGRTLDFIKSEFGDVEGYLDSIGFHRRWRELLRTRFLHPF